jgi:hypothetical protein
LFFITTHSTAQKKRCLSIIVKATKEQTREREKRRKEVDTL